MASVSARDGLRALLDDVRTSYGTAPSEEVARSHLAAILSEARGERKEELTVVGLRPRRRALRPLLAVAATVVLLCGTLAGLASAGVITLPGPFDVFDREERAPASTVPASSTAPTSTEDPGARDGVQPATRGSTVPSIDPQPSSTLPVLTDNPDRLGTDRPNRRGADSPENPGEQCDGAFEIPGIACGP